MTNIFLGNCKSTRQMTNGSLLQFWSFVFLVSPLPFSCGLMKNLRVLATWIPLGIDLGGDRLFGSMCTPSWCSYWFWQNPVSLMVFWSTLWITAYALTVMFLVVVQVDSHLSSFWENPNNKTPSLPGFLVRALICGFSGSYFISNHLLPRANYLWSLRSFCAFFSAWHCRPCARLEADIAALISYWLWLWYFPES
jgi:hypothetical protein